MKDITVHSSCRVCSGKLVTVLDLGSHCLSGQFPAAGEPDPLRAPLDLCRCLGCGLVQLRHTVRPELLYRNYGYRSGTTETMRQHLKGIADEAKQRVKIKSALDIGCNDGTFLSNLPLTCFRVGIDPSNALPMSVNGSHLFKGFFPSDFDNFHKFDLITSLACFYDTDNPLSFAAAVKKHLEPEGVWCLEVADLDCILANGDYSQVCHEHLCYYDLQAIDGICKYLGLVITDYSYNSCNWGTLRVWIKHQGHTGVKIPPRKEYDFGRFAERVNSNRRALIRCLERHKSSGRTVHLLGASTKMNTVLQYCNASKYFQCASDRDVLKQGKRTPGTSIMIVSEATSRAMQPNVYVTCLQHFRSELIEREREFLKRGSIVFVLPICEEVNQVTSTNLLSSSA